MYISFDLYIDKMKKIWYYNNRKNIEREVAMAKRINSKLKGKVGENELVHKLKDLGFDCHRSQQFKGNTKSDDDADVVGIEGLHIECKRNEKLNVESALQQAERDNNNPDNIPVVMWRKNREEWKATVRLGNFMKMFSEYIKNRKEKG